MMVSFRSYHIPKFPLEAKPTGTLQISSQSTPSHKDHKARKDVNRSFRKISRLSLCSPWLSKRKMLGIGG